MGKNYGDYARRLMQIIFSPDDLKTKILPPARRHLSRETLNEEDFNFLLGLIIRFFMSMLDLDS